MRIKTLFLVMASLMLSIGAIAQSPNWKADAKLKAYAIVEQYAELSKLKDVSGKDLEMQYLELFALNAKVPVDFYGEGANGDNAMREVSPTSLCTEYYSKGIEEPLPVSTEIIKGRTEMELSSTGDHYIVQVTINRSFTKVVSEKELITLLNPKETVQQVQVRVAKNGVAKISGIRPYQTPPTENKWQLDLYRYGGGKGDLRTTSESGIAGLDDAALKVGVMGLRVGYRFNPFKGMSPTMRKKFSLDVGLGFESWRYRMNSLDLTGGKEVDYLESQTSDDVIHLQQPTELLNDQGGSDFIRYSRSTFEEETLKKTALTIRAGASYALFTSERMSTELGTGFGYMAGGKANVEMSTSDTQYAVFAEGVFEDAPVTIGTGQVTYNGNTEIFTDPDNIYGFIGSANAVTYTMELPSSMYWDLKLTQFFNFGSLELGAFLSMRRHLSSTLDNSDLPPSDLADIRNSGVPALRAFVVQATPAFLGFGISIQKTN